MFAGFVGAAVLAALMIAKAELGLLPAIDFIAMLGGITHTGPVGGWMIHFFIGIVWGGLFAWLDPDLPGDSLRQRGVLFSLAGWCLMMIVVMPWAGAGLFALKLGILAPVLALVFHVVFGWVLGGTYAWLFVQMIPLRYRQPHLELSLRSRASHAYHFVLHILRRVRASRAYDVVARILIRARDAFPLSLPLSGGAAIANWMRSIKSRFGTIIRDQRC
jgi:hypothetical protein